MRLFLLSSLFFLISLSFKVDSGEYEVTDAFGNKYTVLAEYDREGDLHYTQCFNYVDPGRFLETGGLYQQSTIHFLQIEPYKLTHNQKLNAKIFAEGCALYHDEEKDKDVVLMLTYKEKKVYSNSYDLRIPVFLKKCSFKFDGDDLSQIEEYAQPNELLEGWGMAARSENVDGIEKTLIYTTDGSSKVYVYDTGLNLVRALRVKEGLYFISRLNELEFVNNSLWANVYLSNEIVVIDPSTGLVTKRWDFSQLVTTAINYMWDNYQTRLQHHECLNGIAFDPSTGQ